MYQLSKPKMPKTKSYKGSIKDGLRTDHKVKICLYKSLTRLKNWTMVVHLIVLLVNPA